MILKSAAYLAESSCTRDHRQHAIISLSGALKTTFQQLLTACEEEENVEGERKESLVLTKKYSTSLKQEVNSFKILIITSNSLIMYTCSFTESLSTTCQTPLLTSSLPSRQC